MRGMKYESTDPAEVARYITDPAWIMEQKLDGIRCIVRTDDNGRASFYSHTGELLKSGSRHFAAIAADIACLRNCTVDGELLEGGDLWLFDILEAVGTDTRLLVQRERRNLLNLIAAGLPDGRVHVTPEAATTEAKRELWDRVQANNLEGVVVKRSAARYETGSKHTRTADVRKIKITRTIDCVVIGRNSDGHNNATLGLYDGTEMVTVGRCSMNGKTPAQVGDVIEVTFLGMYAGNRTLTQPRMMRARPDKTAADCLVDQLIGCDINRKVLAG